MTERVRTTISIDPEVLELFQRMSALSGVSVSRCMGDWLSDTRDGAEHVFNQLRQAKELSRGALSNLHARLQSGEAMDYLTSNGQRAVSAGVLPDAQQRGVPQPAPRSRRAPSSNTGLKSTGVGKSTTSGKS